MRGLVETLFRISCSGALLAVVIFLLQRLVQKHLSARMSYFVWMVLVVRLLLPVTWQWTLPADPAETMPGETEGQLVLDAAAVPPDELGALPVTIVSKNHTDAGRTDFVLILYFGGICVYAAILFISARRYKSGLALAPVSAAVNQLFSQAKRGFRNVKRARVTEGNVESPCVTGFLRPTVIIPSNWELTAGRDVLYESFRHELAHVAGGDLLVRALLLVLQGAYWFNPVIWISFILIRRDAEYACDERVLQLSSPAEQKAYGSALVEAARLSQKVPEFASFISAPLKKRIQRIAKYRSARVSASIIMVCTLLLSTACAVGLGIRFIREPFTPADIDSVSDAPQRTTLIGYRFSAVNDPLLDQKKEYVIDNVSLYDELKLAFNNSSAIDAPVQEPGMDIIYLSFPQSGESEVVLYANDIASQQQAWLRLPEGTFLSFESILLRDRAQYLYSEIDEAFDAREVHVLGPTQDFYLSPDDFEALYAMWNVESWKPMPASSIQDGEVTEYISFNRYPEIELSFNYAQRYIYLAYPSRSEHYVYTADEKVFSSLRQTIAETHPDVA